jgi:tetratricopeptide (TPR) repeat protein
MTVRYYLLSTLLALSMIAGAKAQINAGDPFAVKPAQAEGGAGKEEGPALRARQMQEDVSVFRILLNRNLSRYYGLPAMQDAAHAHPAADGVYLKGYGVVFNTGVPAPSNHPVRKQEPGAAESTPWEKTRRELRGEPVTADAKPAETHKKPLSEVVLALLAENGHHFKQLAPDERITVALTLRTSQECMKCHSTTPVAGMFTEKTHAGQLRHVLGKEPRLATFYRQTIPMAGPEREWDPVAEANRKPLALRPLEDNDVLLGDLQYKQGRYQEAEQAYTRALQKLQDKKDPEGQLRRFVLLAEVCTKLAQCALARGDSQKATTMIEAAKKFSEAALKRSEEPDKGKRPHLPAQLVISATKTQLDQVASRKMSLEEFSKAASVEYRTFDAEEKKDGMK